MKTIARKALTSLGDQLDDCGNEGLAGEHKFWLKMRMSRIFNRFLKIDRNHLAPAYR